MIIGTTDKLAELAPTLAARDVDEQWEMLAAYQKRIEPFRARMGAPQKYFLSRSHDARILSLNKKNRKDLRLTLKDYATFVFALALIDKKSLNIDIDNLAFPVEICSKGTKHLSMNRLKKRSGKLAPIRFRKMHIYLYDEIITWQENEIEMVFEMYSCSREISYAYVLLACEGFEVTEHQTEAWQRYFGNAYDDYYEYFLTKRNEGAFLSESSICKDLIDEYEMSKRAVTPRCAIEKNA